MTHASSRLLIVEDEAAIAMGLRDGLAAEGFVVDVVGDGEAAEAQARQVSYDLIVLDLALPKKDGLAVCRDLRASRINTPIIAVTARAQEIDRVIGFELGVDDYVTKPFSARELVGRIKAVLRRTASPVSQIDVWRRGDLVVDFRRFEAFRAEQPLDLTPREFKLLKVFVGHRGEVLSVRRLIDLVWGADVFVTDRVIYTHINNLRAKIEPDPSAPAILQNVRGAGYRFDG